MKLKYSFYLIIVTFCCVKGLAVAGDCTSSLVSGYHTDCKVKRGKTEFSCFRNASLLPNDRIEQRDIDSIVLQLGKSAKKKKVDASTYEIICMLPDNNRNIIQTFMKKFKLTKSDHSDSYAASRRYLESIRLPNSNATLICCYPTKYSWVGFGHDIVIRDNKKKEIYRASVRDKQSIQLFPEDIGIKEDIAYEWFIDGLLEEKPYSFTLLPSDLSEQIIANLKLIDDEKISNNDKIITKSAYLQLLSYSYPHIFDLYWLSYQIISDLNAKSLESDSHEILQRLNRNHKKALGLD